MRPSSGWSPGDRDRERLLGHTSATSSPSSGSRSGSLTAATPSTKPVVELPGRDRARDPTRSATRTVTASAGATSAAAKPAASGVAPIRSERGGPADHPRDVGARRVQAQQDRLGVLEQPLAGLGRLDRPPRQQRRPEVGLQHAMCWETADCV